MVRENEPIYGPASPKELGKALERLYTGQRNVAKQAKSLRMPLERLKQLFNAYVAERPIDITMRTFTRLIHNWRGLTSKQGLPSFHVFMNFFLERF